MKVPWHKISCWPFLLKISIWNRTQCLVFRKWKCQDVTYHVMPLHSTAAEMMIFRNKDNSEDTLLSQCGGHTEYLQPQTIVQPLSLNSLFLSPNLDPTSLWWWVQTISKYLSLISHSLELFVSAKLPAVLRILEWINYMHNESISNSI